MAAGPAGADLELATLGQVRLNAGASQGQMTPLVSTVLRLHLANPKDTVGGLHTSVFLEGLRSPQGSPLKNATRSDVKKALAEAKKFKKVHKSASLAKASGLPY